VSDSPEEIARRRKLLEELVRMSEEAGLYENEPTPEEIVATVKQVRKKIAEERKVKPTNSAARNAMSEFERKCYDWGWADAEKNIIKLLEDDGNCIFEDHPEYACNCKVVSLIKRKLNSNLKVTKSNE
jgi:hypothetical protein